jgi:Uma2 family endonuclease
LPFLSADGSEPEPDFAVIPGDDPRASAQHPSSAVLIIEISDTTLEHDRLKSRLYAASAVPEYWIINLVTRSLEVHRHPEQRQNDFVYADTQILTGQQQLSSMAANLPISISELLP